MGNFDHTKQHISNPFFLATNKPTTTMKNNRDYKVIQQFQWRIPYQWRIPKQQQQWIITKETVSVCIILPIQFKMSLSRKNCNAMDNLKMSLSSFQTIIMKGKMTAG